MRRTLGLIGLRGGSAGGLAVGVDETRAVGIRVACLRCEGVAELFAMIEQGPPVEWIEAADMARSLAREKLLRRLPTASEVADVATFLASDRTTALTATIANVSYGAIVE